MEDAGVIQLVPPRQKNPTHHRQSRQTGAFPSSAARNTAENRSMASADMTV